MSKRKGERGLTTGTGAFFRSLRLAKERSIGFFLGLIRLAAKLIRVQCGDISWVLGGGAKIPISREILLASLF